MYEVIIFNKTLKWMQSHLIKVDFFLTLYKTIIIYAAIAHLIILYMACKVRFSLEDMTKHHTTKFDAIFQHMLKIQLYATHKCTEFYTFKNEQFQV